MIKNAALQMDNLGIITEGYDESDDDTHSKQSLHNSKLRGSFRSSFNSK